MADTQSAENAHPDGSVCRRRLRTLWLLYGAEQLWLDPAKIILGLSFGALIGYLTSLKRNSSLATGLSRPPQIAAHLMAQVINLQKIDSPHSSTKTRFLHLIHHSEMTH